MNLPHWLSDATRIVAVFLIAIVLRVLIHRLVDRYVSTVVRGTAQVEKTTTSLLPRALRPGTTDAEADTKPAENVAATLLSQRDTQRASTVVSVMKSLTTTVIMSVAFVTVLGILSIPIGPLLASAGIAGVALGFGAQSLVRDVISGLFMLLEDQYGVGDQIDVGVATGTVESVGLRVTQIRADDGALWHVRNGEIARVANSSQGWVRSTIILAIATDADVNQVRSDLQHTINQTVNDPGFHPDLVQEPTITGIYATSTRGMLLNVVVLSLPGKEGALVREIREHISATFNPEVVSVIPAGVHPE